MTFITHLFSNFSLKSVHTQLKTQNSQYQEIVDNLQAYIDTNVFDLEAKEDIEGVLDD